MDIFVVLVPPVNLWSSLLNLVVQGNYFQPKISIKYPAQQPVSEFSSLGGPLCGEHRCRQHSNKLKRAMHPCRGRWNMSPYQYQDPDQKGYTLMKYIFCFSKDCGFLGLEDTLNIFWFCYLENGL